MPYTFKNLLEDPSCRATGWTPTASIAGLEVVSEPITVHPGTQEDMAGTCRKIKLPSGTQNAGAISKAWQPHPGEDWLFLAAYIKPLTGFAANTSYTFSLAIGQWGANSAWIGYTLSVRGPLPAGRWSMLRGHVAVDSAAEQIAMTVSGPMSSTVPREFLLGRAMACATEENPWWFSGDESDPAYGSSAVVAWPAGVDKAGASIVFDKTPGLWVKKNGAWVSEYPGVTA